MHCELRGDVGGHANKFNNRYGTAEYMVKYFSPEDGDYVSAKRRYLPTSLYGVTTQNNNTVILTAMRISQIVFIFCLLFSVVGFTVLL
jgi:hypothetical protein